MLSDDLTIKLNSQINSEASSVVLYMQMSAWCSSKGYDGCADFFRLQADEEKMHLERLFDYMLETGALPQLGQIDAPQTTWKDVRELFSVTLEHELQISHDISTLVEVALAEKDFSTHNFLQWYVAEQHEEEHKFRTLLDRIDLITAEGHGLYTIDREVSRLTTGGKPSVK
ncbi:ferritin [Gammaproteobacteria bacterium 50_400_T64]|nr:ferritin [Gammaproteobacteria bacterium 50_400_T64]